jgi:hypothetical protein
MSQVEIRLAIIAVLLLFTLIKKITTGRRRTQQAIGQLARTRTGRIEFRANSSPANSR